MGRMLDSLVRIIEQQSGHEPPPLTPYPSPQGGEGKGVRGREPVCPDEDVRLVDDDMPFIEVGAPGKAIEASPDVLAVPLPKAVQRNSAPAPLPKKQLAAPTLIEPRAKITLEPWPAPNAVQIPEDIITYYQPDHPAAGEYASLFAKMRRVGGQSILFTAAGAADLVTLVLNLAFHAASDATKRIVAVDVDGAAPLARATALDAAHGLHDVLAGAIALENALHATPEPNLRLLTTQAGADFPPEALRWAFGCLRKRADLVLVIAGDAATLCPTLITLCDDAYVVGDKNLSAVTKTLREADKLRGVIKWTIS